jgi:hypothetical protein
MGGSLFFSLPPEQPAPVCHIRVRAPVSNVLI